MSEESNGLVGSNLFCHYGESNDVFVIGGLIKTGDTLMTSDIRHCRHLINFRLIRNNLSYLAKVLKGFKDHGPIKI